MINKTIKISTYFMQLSHQFYIVLLHVYSHFSVDASPLAQPHRHPTQQEIDAIISQVHHHLVTLITIPSLLNVINLTEHGGTRLKQLATVIQLCEWMLNQLVHQEQPLSVQNVDISCFVTSGVSVILVNIIVLLKVMTSITCM